jgi:hypothetical protein
LFRLIGWLVGLVGFFGFFGLVGLVVGCGLWIVDCGLWIGCQLSLEEAGRRGRFD